MDILNHTIFAILGYRLSLLELAGVLSGFAAVYLAFKEKPVNFLFGLVNNVIYFVLFFQYRLYSVMLLQIVYFIFSIYGYYYWKHPKKEESDVKNEQRIRILKWNERLLYIVIILIAGYIWGWAVIKLQARFPEYFDPPAYPWLDAELTMASIAGQWLLSRKIWDNWPLWIIVDTISWILYASMGIYFTSALYAVYALIALSAVVEWQKTYRKYICLNRSENAKLDSDFVGHEADLSDNSKLN